MSTVSCAALRPSQPVHIYAGTDEVGIDTLSVVVSGMTDLCLHAAFPSLFSKGTIIHAVRMGRPSAPRLHSRQLEGACIMGQRHRINRKC